MNTSPPIPGQRRRPLVPDILHQDADLVVISKPAGLLTARGRWAPDEPTVFTELARRGIRDICLVHRIDKETSGVLVLARSRRARYSLPAQWARGKVKKTYLAIVAGVPDRDLFTIDLPLRTGPDRKRVIVGPGPDARTSMTECRVAERFRNHALLEINPHTGRRHQIRAHLQAAGLPIVGDALYGGPLLLLSALKPHCKRTDDEEQPLIRRVALHALSIEFDHPSGGDRVRFDAPVPKDFAVALKYLRRFRTERPGTPAPSG